MKTTESGAGKQGSRSERVTVNLMPRSTAGLYLTMGRTGDSKTDVINRHIQEGSLIEDLIARGGRVFFQEPGEDELTRLTILL